MGMESAWSERIGRRAHEEADEGAKENEVGEKESAPGDRG